MQRQCDVCGRSYEAKRASSKYDSDLCRKRAQRNGLTRSRRPSRPSMPAASAEAPESPQEKAMKIGAVTPAVLEELTKLRVQDTAVGRVALALSVRLDTSTFDTASAVATLGKTVIDAVAAAVKVAQPQDDPMDEFSTRLQKKFAGT